MVEPTLLPIDVMIFSDVLAAISAADVAGGYAFDYQTIDVSELDDGQLYPTAGSVLVETSGFDRIDDFANRPVGPYGENRIGMTWQLSLECWYRPAISTRDVTARPIGWWLSVCAADLIRAVTADVKRGGLARTTEPTRTDFLVDERVVGVGFVIDFLTSPTDLRLTAAGVPPTLI